MPFPIERQYLKCSKGDVGSMHSKYVLPHVPESLDEKPTEVPRTNAPGETRTESVRRIPPLAVRLRDSLTSGRLCCSCALRPFGISLPLRSSIRMTWMPFTPGSMGNKLLDTSLNRLLASYSGSNASAGLKWKSSCVMTQSRSRRL